MCKVCFLTLGCKVNQTESEALSQLLQGEGFEIVKETGSPEVIIINTCTVTGTGSMKSRKMIRKMVKDHPDSIVAVMGCYSQLKPEEAAGIDGVALIMGTLDRSSLPARLKEIIGRQKGRIQTEESQRTRFETADGDKPDSLNSDCKTENTGDATELIRWKPLMVVGSFDRGAVYEELPIIHNESRTRAMLKIQDGCSQFCTYCIVPYARGPSRSRNLENVLAEARELLQTGYKEIVLTGVHIGMYGRDITDRPVTLAGLVADLCRLPGMKRLRLGSIEPMEFTPELLEVIFANRAIVCPHFHIPLQSGSDSILKQMNRPYTTDEFAGLLSRIRSMIPDAAIAADVMTGFPGETEQEFQETLKFIESCRFARIHVFPYSRRPGTPAADMPGQIPNAVKSDRVRQLIRLGRMSSRMYAEQFYGQPVEVLVENVRGDGSAHGHSRNYLELLLPAALYTSLTKDEDDDNRIHKHTNKARALPFWQTGDLITCSLQEAYLLDRE